MATNTKPPRESVVPHAFLSVASHELRGPIGVARGYLRLLQQDQALSERSQKAVAGAREAVERVVGLLDEMSEYARLIQGDPRLERVPVLWSDLLGVVAARTTVPSAPIVTWSATEAPPGAQCHVDRVRLEAALATLANALARAQVQDTALAMTVMRGVRSSVLDIAANTTGRAEWRLPDLSRAGLGFALVLADAVIGAHGGRVLERWQDGRWTGYRVTGLR